LPSNVVLRPTELKDINQIKALIKEYLTKFSVFTVYSKKDC